MNQKRDGLSMLLQELLANVTDTELKHRELIVNTLQWVSVLLDLCRGGNPSTTFAQIPARQAVPLSRCLTDVGRGELICALEYHGMTSSDIRKHLGVTQRWVCAFRTMGEQPEDVKDLLQTNDVPESTFRKLQTEGKKRNLANLLACLGWVRRTRGQLPLGGQIEKWESALRKHPESDAFELLMEVLDKEVLDQ